MKSGQKSIRSYFELSGVFIIAVLVAACNIGGANFNIFPDKSGTAEFVEMVFDFGDSEVKRSDFQGIRRKQLAHMSMKTTGYEFEDASKALLGGIKLDVKDKGSDMVIRADIPLAKTAGWYQALNISEDKKKATERFMKVIQKSMGGGSGPLPGGAMKGMAELMRVNIGIFGPGKIKSKKIIAPAGTYDWFHTEKKDAAGGGGGGMGGAADKVAVNEARLRIPLDVLLAGKHPRIIVEVVAEKKLVPAAKEKWEKFKKKEDFLNPMGKGGGMGGM